MAVGKLGLGQGHLGALGGGQQMPSPSGFSVLKGLDNAYLKGLDGAFLLGPVLSTSPAKSAIVSVDLTTLGATIPADFVGISGEVSDFVAGAYQGTTGAPGSYLNVLSLLGSSGKLRIGGASSAVPTTPAITQTTANNLSSFVSGLGSGWSVIYGLDLNANDSVTAATQAGFLNNALGSKVTFQFGNEPFTGGTYTATTYPPAWNAYYTAVTGAVAGAKFGACDDNQQGTSQTAIGSLTPGVSGLQFISVHYYTQNGNATDWPSLQAAIQSDDFFRVFLLPFANTNGKPLIMSEMNSVNNGGFAGVSDRMMSQSYFLRMAIRLAKFGWSGVTIHNALNLNGSQAVYNPIYQDAVSSKYYARPIFYGMYLFSRLAGKQVAASTKGGTANIEWMAVKEASGNASILISNNEATDTAFIKPMQSAAWTTATVLLSRDADGLGQFSSSMTLGGQPIGLDGAWTGAPFTINNGDSVAIPPCGAAYIQFQT